MRRSLGPLLFTALIFALNARGAFAAEGPSPGAAAAAAGTFHVVELSGSGFARGLQHGRALRAEIAEAVRRWKDDLKASRKQEPDLLISAFLRDTDFVPAIKRWTPDLLDEVRGIAEGAQQPFETMLAYQLVDEIWVYFDAQDAHHCSSVGVARRGDQPAIVAQNLDLESFRHGSQTLLRIRRTPTEPEQLVVTAAGLIGANGMNGGPVAVAVNTLMQLSASRDGLPVAFVVRGLLARTGERAVLDFLTSVRHASGQNYIVGVGDSVYDFEASASQVVRFQPMPGGSPVYHTNHPLANRDLKPWYARRLDGDSSFVRYGSLDLRLGAKDADLGEAGIEEVLRSKDSEANPVCRPLREGASTFTFASVLMTLGARPTLQATYGPPDRSDYTTFALAAPGAPPRGR